MKRKFDDINNEYSDYSDDDNYSDNPKFRKYYDKIKKKEITKMQIINSNLNEDDKLWFIEYIDILNNIPHNTEEKYNLKNKIYQRYNDIINNIEEPNIIKKIQNSNYDNNIKQILISKYNKFKNSPEEINKITEWIDTILDIPTECINIHNKNVKKTIETIYDKLNEHIYGLNSIKEKILEIYAAMHSGLNYKNKIIALVGPPGVGKTAFASCVAEALGLPFEHISMGCIKDVNTLIGHSTTYIGSKCGLITDTLRKLKYKNGVILLDELDKINHTNENRSITSVLLHLLDKTQNNKFKDMYMPEINIDLSNIFFIAALNDINLIDPILKDRLLIININGYSNSEKYMIAKNYLLPKIKKNLNLNNDININDDTIKYIIEKYDNNNLGVRYLEKIFCMICEKINLLKILNTNNNKIKLSYKLKIKFPMLIDNKSIDILLHNI